MGLRPDSLLSRDGSVLLSKNSSAQLNERSPYFAICFTDGQAFYLRHNISRAHKPKAVVISHDGFWHLTVLKSIFDYSTRLTEIVLRPNRLASAQLGTQMSISRPLMPPPVSLTRYWPL
jgi:hypothetical protein